MDEAAGGHFAIAYVTPGARYTIDYDADEQHETVREETDFEWFTAPMLSQ